LNFEPTVSFLFEKCSDIERTRPKQGKVCPKPLIPNDYLPLFDPQIHF
jgi:hypothetical protein